MKTLAIAITVLMTLAPAHAVVSVWNSVNDALDPWELVAEETFEEIAPAATTFNG